MEGALDEMKRRFNQDFSGRLINNLEQRGNTATTSHLLALRDSILQQKIRSGDDILFSISGSGQTTGTALYTCDDLPERLRSNTVTRNGNGTSDKSWGQTLSVPWCIESIATVQPAPGESADTLAMLNSAASRCLESSQFAKKQIGLLLFTGVYRTDFLTEPAVAALLAGDLEMNDVCNRGRAAQDARFRYLQQLGRVSERVPSGFGTRSSRMRATDHDRHGRS